MRSSPHVPSRLPGSAVALLAVIAGGCDPIVNIYGSFFPAWTISLLIALAVTIVLRILFAATGLERHLKPLVLVYPCLLLLLSCMAWLILFRS